MRLACLIAIAGCSSSSASRDVVGPFTGDTHRFVVDRFNLPAMSMTNIGDDLDGDGRIDNRAAQLAGSLAALDDLNQHAQDMIASGALASEIEIVADNLAADATVAVYYRGAAGDLSTPVGGKLSTAGFEPNRTRETQVPGEAVIRIPVFADADPMTVRAVGLEIVLTPDGQGGFDGVVAGGLLPADLHDPEFTAVTQMLTANPQDHVLLVSFSDFDRDGVLSRTEVASSLLSLSPQVDIRLFDEGRFHPDPSHNAKPDTISFGVQIHISPCASGRCATTPPADRCHDRLRDGDETDIDCGGSCQPCGAAAACQLPADCLTAACDGGHCRAPSCSDGLRDGFETDLDCGGPCPACAVGKHCYSDHDCAPRTCGRNLACQ
jgi:hypothetical protein